MRPDHPAFDQGGHGGTVSPYDAVAGDRRTRIDAKNNHRVTQSLADHLFDVDIEVGPHLLYVVDLLEGLEQLEQRRRLLAADLARAFLDHRHFALDHRYAALL